MRKKILFVNEKFGRQGGAEKNIEAIGTRLKSEHDLIFLYSIKTDIGETVFSTIFHHQYQLHFSDTSNNIHATIQAIIKRELPDLIYLHKCLSIPVYEALLNSKIPIVHMEHDHEVYCLRGSKSFPISRKICTHKAGLCCLFPGLAFIYRDPETGKLRFRKVSYCEQQRRIKLDQQCNRFIVASHYMKRELIRQGYNEKKIRIVPPVTPFEIGSTNHQNNSNQLLYVGQLLKGKGLDCLLEALKFVKMPFQLNVIGKGPFQSACEKLVKDLHMEEKVHFLGYVSPENLTNYYKNSAIGIVPSVWPEPFGMVGIEMMSYGLPVIGFDSGGISDWLIDGKNGYLISWMDVRQMGEKIESLLQDHQMRSNMSQYTRTFVMKQYNFESCYKSLLECFEEVMLYGAGV